MHSFLVIFAYLAMLFAPCAVAQWGDVLVIPWTVRLGRSGRAYTLHPFFASLRRRFSVWEVSELAQSAFVAPRVFSAAGGATLLEAAGVGEQTASFEQAAARVAARLAEMVAEHRKANAAPEAAPEAAPAAQPIRLLPALRDAVPMVASWVFGLPPIFLSSVPSPPGADAVEVSRGEAVAASPPGEAHALEAAA